MHAAGKLLRHCCCRRRGGGAACDDGGGPLCRRAGAGVAADGPRLHRPGLDGALHGQGAARDADSARRAGDRQPASARRQECVERADGTNARRHAGGTALRVARRPHTCHRGSRARQHSGAGQAGLRQPRGRAAGRLPARAGHCAERERAPVARTLGAVARRSRRAELSGEHPLARTTDILQRRTALQVAHPLRRIPKSERHPLRALHQKQPLRERHQDVLHRQGAVQHHAHCAWWKNRAAARNFIQTEVVSLQREKRIGL